MVRLAAPGGARRNPTYPGTIKPSFCFPPDSLHHSCPLPPWSWRVHHPGGAQIEGVKLLSSGPSPEKPRVKKHAAPTDRRDRDAGAALRSVYQKTVEEAVPDDLLDLLGKLS